MKTTNSLPVSTGHGISATTEVFPATNSAARSATTSIEAAVPKWFVGLDSIRFVLAFVVLVSHCPDPLFNNADASGTTMLHYLGALVGLSFSGITAVIAFFIISGFVIHYPNRNGIRNVKNFYLRRLIRVLIPLIAIKLLGSFFGNPENAVVWSLYCELIYYILYPFLSRVKATWQTKMLCAYLVSIVVIGILGRHDIESMFTQSDRGYKGDFWQFGVAFTWLIGLPFWLLGVNLALKIDSLTRKVSTQQIFLYRAAIVALAVVCGFVWFHAYISYLITLTALSIPIVNWLAAEILYHKSTRPIRFLENSGKFSYSLYLCHPLLIALLLRVIPLTSTTYFFYLLLCVAGAYGFYLLLERPAHLLAERLTRPAKLT